MVLDVTLYAPCVDYVNFYQYEARMSGYCKGTGVKICQIFSICPPFSFPTFLHLSIGTY